MRLFGMDVRHTRWSLLLSFACALSACDIGPGGPLGLGGNNPGIAIGGTGGGGARVLSFSVQPSTATAGNIITPPVQVLVSDSLGIVDSTFAAAITIKIGVNPVAGNLSGTTSVTPLNGTAQFGDLSIDKAGTGYVLRASASGATGASSNSFNILAP